MANRKLKIVVWGTGNVAGVAIRCILGREDMQLVGVWAHKETAGHLVGTDAGLLDSDSPCGVIITDDEEKLFSLKPDCIVCAINIRDLVAAEKINGEWYKKFLEHGICVVSPSVPSLIYPPACMTPGYIESIEAACKKGNAAIYLNGQEPGFAEHMALFLSTCANTMKSITTTEMFNYSTAPIKQELSIPYGFDEPMEYKAMFEDPNMQIFCWGSPIRNVADTLGYQLEGVTAHYEKRVTDKDIPVGWGTIKKGNVAAIRSRVCGIVNGREAIVIEHINRMCNDIAPDWETTNRVGQVRVKIEGDPNLQMDFNVGVAEKPEELSYDGYVMTAMRIVNAIPYLCEAPAGIHTIHDLPLTTPKEAFRSDSTFINHKICKAK